MSKRSRSTTRRSTKSGRLTRWLLALVLLPCLWAVAHQTGRMFPQLMEEGARAWWLYLAGVLSYLVFERLLTKPMWLYVFGHEMTHALTAVLSGAKVHSFKAKSTGGEVRLSKSNAFIAISPYIIPIYLVVIVLVYAVTRRWWNPPQLLPVFQFLLGAALAFHISLTISAIHRHQPDLKVLGFFLSGVLILMGNTLVLAALGIGLFAKTPTFPNYARSVGAETVVAWGVTLDVAWDGIQRGVAYVKERSWTR